MERIKNIYHTTLILLAICLIATIVFMTFELYDFMPRLFLFIFGLISFLNKSEYKSIIAKKRLSSDSMILIASTLISCIGYIIYMFFVFGRYFIRFIL